MPVQRRKLAALGLAGTFAAVVITGELGTAFYKPHPAGFELLAERLGTDPASMAYVGDNPLVDFAPAKHLGMTTLRVRTAEFQHETQGTEWVDHTFDRPDQAIEWALAALEGRQIP
jgi:FMN phosphatase YigB (HAD superfamily)